MLAGENDSAARCADRVGDEAPVEAHAFVGEAVEVGRLVDGRAVGAQGAGGVVVGEDKDDVGAFVVGGGYHLLGGRFARGSDSEAKQGKQEGEGLRSHRFGGLWVGVIWGHKGTETRKGFFVPLCLRVSNCRRAYPGAA